jgi:hypothetical protein
MNMDRALQTKAGHQGPGCLIVLSASYLACYYFSDESLHVLPYLHFVSPFWQNSNLGHFEYSTKLKDFYCWAL